MAFPPLMTPKWAGAAGARRGRTASAPPPERSGDGSVPRCGTLLKSLHHPPRPQRPPAPSSLSSVGPSRSSRWRIGRAAAERTLPPYSRGRVRPRVESSDPSSGAEWPQLTATHRNQPPPLPPCPALGWSCSTVACKQGGPRGYKTRSHRPGHRPRMYMTRTRQRAFHRYWGSAKTSTSPSGNSNSSFR